MAESEPVIYIVLVIGSVSLIGEIGLVEAIGVPLNSPADLVCWSFARSELGVDVETLSCSFGEPVLDSCSWIEAVTGADATNALSLCKKFAICLTGLLRLAIGLLWVERPSANAIMSLVIFDQLISQVPVTSKDFRVFSKVKALSYGPATGKNSAWHDWSGDSLHILEPEMLH